MYRLTDEWTETLTSVHATRRRPGLWFCKDDHQLSRYVPWSGAVDNRDLSGARAHISTWLRDRSTLGLWTAAGLALTIRSQISVSTNAQGKYDLASVRLGNVPVAWAYILT